MRDRGERMEDWRLSDIGGRLGREAGRPHFRCLQNGWTRCTTFDRRFAIEFVEHSRDLASVPLYARKRFASKAMSEKRNQCAQCDGICRARERVMSRWPRPSLRLPSVSTSGVMDVHSKKSARYCAKMRPQ